MGPRGRRAREAVVFLLEKEKAERPQITMIRHGLAIFDALELDEIGSVRFNRELRRLDLPEARWTRYRGPGGTDCLNGHLRSCSRLARPPDPGWYCQSYSRPDGRGSSQSRP
jgi:hypothetical protein